MSSLVGLSNNLLMPIFDRLDISVTIFLVMKIETPYTTDFIIFGLKHVMACKNSFTSGRSGLNYTPNKL